MHDPTVEFVSIEIEKKKYQMAFDLGSLAEAEAELNNLGIEVNLLRCLDFRILNLNMTRTLFAASLRKAHPEISYQDACNLVTHRTVHVIGSALATAWTNSVVGEDDLEKKPEPTTEPETATPRPAIGLD